MDGHFGPPRCVSPHLNTSFSSQIPSPYARRPTVFLQSPTFRSFHSASGIYKNPPLTIQCSSLPEYPSFGISRQLGNIGADSTCSSAGDRDCFSDSSRSQLASQLIQGPFMTFVQHPLVRSSLAFTAGPLGSPSREGSRHNFSGFGCSPVRESIQETMGEVVGQAQLCLPDHSRHAARSTTPLCSSLLRSLSQGRSHQSTAFSLTSSPPVVEQEAPREPAPLLHAPECPGPLKGRFHLKVGRLHSLPPSLEYTVTCRMSHTYKYTRDKTSSLLHNCSCPFRDNHSSVYRQPSSNVRHQQDALQVVGSLVRAPSSNQRHASLFSGH